MRYALPPSKSCDGIGDHPEPLGSGRFGGRGEEDLHADTYSQVGSAGGYVFLERSEQVGCAERGGRLAEGTDAWEDEFLQQVREGKTEWIGDFANLSFVDVGG